jgi:hypothetical protein
MIITVDELKNYKIGFDFSKFSDEVLEQMIKVATEIISDYTGGAFSSGEIEIEDEAIVTEDRIFV